MQRRRLSYSLVGGYVYLITACLVGLVAVGILLFGDYLVGALIALATLGLAYASALYQVNFYGSAIVVASIYRRPRRYAAHDFGGFEKRFDPTAPVQIRFTDGKCYRFNPLLPPVAWWNYPVWGPTVLDAFTASWTQEITSAACA